MTITFLDAKLDFSLSPRTLCLFYYQVDELAPIHQVQLVIDRDVEQASESVQIQTLLKTCGAAGQMFQWRANQGLPLPQNSDLFYENVDFRLDSQAPINYRGGTVILQVAS